VCTRGIYNISQLLSLLQAKKLRMEIFVRSIKNQPLKETEPLEPCCVIAMAPTTIHLAHCIPAQNPQKYQSSTNTFSHRVIQAASLTKARQLTKTGQL
jgi:hypothetical protein